ncbi:hypothetical protein OQE61_09080 [Cetobacterium somerae]|uniref:hypothetical protein n=1 Tax=Cetobacterium somerae TaxID=188913 RepID=UPI00225A6D90|nr:hypothetical protein [Cetobacterium somerae]MCX3067650.1 hypothetical protein [Cetobacterium somerae]
MKEKVSKFKSLLVATSVLGMVTYSSAMGAARNDIPLANYDIGNQATLTYQTLGGTNKLLQSNIVLTTINQTYALALDPDRIVEVTAGKDALFNHTLTNYGNGTDSFKITHDYTGRTVTMYLDSNNNGVLDAGENEIVPSNGEYLINEIGPWESQSIIVRVSTTGSETAQVTSTLTAKSVGNVTKTDTATETIKFTAKANVGVYKALSSASGASDVAREVTVYLKVFNDSTTYAKDAVLTDTLNTKFTYVENSAKWQDYKTDTVTSITDNYDQSGIVYSVTKKNSDGTGNDIINFTVKQVPQNTLVESKGGVLSFKVLVKEGETVGSITNKATFQFKSGEETTPITGKESNTVTYSVLKYVRATFTGDTVANAQAGQEIRFVNVFKNVANAPEIYNLAIADKFFPVGTTFRMALQTPGQGERPALDNNGDGIIDTGTVEINETVNVILYAQLPQNITNLQSNYTVKKVATSTHTPTYNLNVLDTLTTLTAATVDLTNREDLATNINAPGKGLGPEQSPVTQISLNPGQTGNLVLYVNNTSSYITDTFKLEVSTKADFSDQNLPVGVGVKFKISGGVEVTSTTPILPNNSLRVDAEVSVALNTTAKTVPLYFRVTSLTTGAKDIKYDAVTVNAIRNVSITPNNTGSTYAGGQVIYTHTVRNNGNVLEGDGNASNVFIVLSETQTWAATDVFLDTNGNGIFDIGIDTPFGDFATIGGLTPGQEVKIFTRVVAQVGAPAGSINITTVRPDVTVGTYSTPAVVTVATDTTTILAEDLTIIKGQKLTAGGTYVTTTQKANPEDIIYYRIEVKNNGAVDAKNVQIKDTVPYFTTIISGTGAGEGTGYKASYIVTDAQGTTSTFKVAETQPATGTRGEIIANVGTLKPNEKAALYFQVKIDRVPAKP